MLAWLGTLGQLVRVGVEGSGAYGAGLAQFLQAAGVKLVEVDRPDRKTRRWQGKSDPVDAEAAARAAQAGRASGVPKTRGGKVDALRALRVTRRSAVAARADAQRQIKALIVGEHYFGLWGALLGVPVLSMLQSIFTHFRFETMPDAPPDSLLPPPGTARIS